MILDPDLIHYACIAKGTTVLAEFNSKDAALGVIAAKCLEKTPSLHTSFSHTIRSRSYTFLIDEPFVYFVISDEKLEKSEVLVFLKSVRDAFGEVSKDEKKLKHLNSYCFQGDFNPVFHQLLGTGLDHMEGIVSPTGDRMGQSGNLQGGQSPVRGRPRSIGEKGLKKIKSRLMGGFKIGERSGEKKESDDDGGIGIGLSREFPLINKNRGMYSPELMGHQKAKKIWKKQVWVVLSLDLIICVILFAVWLWVCSGFKCMES